MKEAIKNDFKKCLEMLRDFFAVLGLMIFLIIIYEAVFL